uniref:Uncharacterized protein n=1 Tax=viral metagenome TaxID=1070528 RepID=A0A6C0I0G4_9ZZZZ
MGLCTQSLNQPLRSERYVFHLLSKEEKGYIRTRQEYNKVTITIKKYPENSKFATEDEIEVNSSFEDTKKFLLAQGFKGHCIGIADGTVTTVP